MEVEVVLGLVDLQRDGCSTISTSVERTTIGLHNTVPAIKREDYWLSSAKLQPSIIHYLLGVIEVTRRLKLQSLPFCIVS